MAEQQSVTILGAGAFGTAMAVILSAAGRRVTLWDYKPGKLDQIRETRENSAYLPGILLPESVKLESNIARAIKDEERIVIAIPSRAVKTVMGAIPDFSGIAVSLTKGLDISTGDTISTQVGKLCPNAKTVALGGPTFASEIARFVPSAMVAASASPEAAEETQALFSTRSLRVYTSPDIKGVEIGGALKNIIAIAAGVSDGLGFGDNSKAALATRAIIEIQRLGIIMGGRSETFLGLSGLGDLMATCFSTHSRNRRFGHLLGEGVAIAQIPEKLGMLVEGVPSCEAAYHFAAKHKVDTPIINEIHKVLHEDKPPRQAIADLINRKLKAEDS